MPTIHIYGIDCQVPPTPKREALPNYGLPLSQQRFKRIEPPDSIWDVSVDDDGDPIYTPEHRSFLEKEAERIENGYWFLNKNIPTYITGDHYYYLNYWVLENGERPDYRDSDRRWFLFMNECRKDPDILGIVRVKKRREGASNQAACVAVKTASTKKNTRVGIISKTAKDASDLFRNMVVFGFKELPFFLQPRTDANDDPKSILNFVKGASRKKKTSAVQNTRREGLNSFIEHRPTALNSFDSGRWDLMLVDEAGKWEVDIGEYWTILKKVLTEGANKVGFALVFSTVNPPNAGGEKFKELWDASNQFDLGRRTGSRLVRYFCPADDGYGGHIDQWGFSKNLSAKESILRDRAASGKEQDIRDYPLTENEAFQFSQSDSPFDLQIIDSTIELLQQKAPYLRKGMFELVNDEVKFVDSAKGMWEVLELPKNAIGVVNSNGRLTPLYTHKYCIGVDPYRLNEASSKYGSKGTIVVFKQYDSNDPENSCVPVAIFRGRPRYKDDFFEHVRLAAMAYGCMATFEDDATDDYKPYFESRGSLRLLSRTPDEAINPVKKKKVGYGVSSRDPYALEKQLKVAISWVDHHAHKCKFIAILDDLKKYDHKDRTERDLSVALFMALLQTMGTHKAEKKAARQTPFLEVFKNDIFNSKNPFGGR